MASKIPTESSSDDEVKEMERPIFSSEERDVIVVVGGAEFYEYRQALRSWSGFFDALFRSGMKESMTNRVEFADKDPKEWKLISELVAPLSTKKVTKDNVLIVLPWFHELLCSQGIKQCDEVLNSMVQSLGDISQREALKTLLDLTLTSLQYDLRAQNSCLLKVEQVVVVSPHLLDTMHLQRITELMLNHGSAKSMLWPIFKASIPSSLSSYDTDTLLRQELLPLFLLKSEFQSSQILKTHKETEASMRKLKSSLKWELNRLSDRTSNAELRPEIRALQERL